MLPYVVGYDGPEEVIKRIAESEIVVGIPSRNVAHTITYVIHNVVEGFKKYYPGTKASIIVCDGLSSDGTVDVVKAYRNRLDIPVVLVPNIRALGKGSAMRTIIELVAKHTNAEALVFLDSDLRSVTPEWVPLLGNAAQECGFATPYYRRHRFDATITNFIARPLTTMAYGIDIRQPIGGDFGLGRKLIEILASTPLWTASPWPNLFGVDIFITHTALAHGITVCEACLKAKIHEAKDPSKSLVNMFREVTGSIYTLLIEYIDVWGKKHLTSTVKPKQYTAPEPPSMNPVEVRINKNNALKKLLEGLSKYSYLYDKILPNKLLQEIGEDAIEKKGIDSEAWAKILIATLIAYSKEPRFRYRVQILNALFSLWQGRLYRYYNEAEKLSSEEVEQLLANEAANMMKYRRELIEKLLI